MLAIKIGAALGERRRPILLIGASRPVAWPIFIRERRERDRARIDFQTVLRRDPFGAAARLELFFGLFLTLFRTSFALFVLSDGSAWLERPNRRDWPRIGRGA